MFNPSSYLIFHLLSNNALQLEKLYCQNILVTLTDVKFLLRLMVNESYRIY